MTTLTIARARGSYRLVDEGGRQCASLHTGWAVMRGTIRIDGMRVPVARRGWRQVVVGDGEPPVLRLGPHDAFLPGIGAGARWAIGRNLRVYGATLGDGDREITLRLAAFTGRRGTVEITGEWPQRDLVVLAALFALLARRRRDITVMSATHG